jgi:hypothetical protein|tara:strand:- start:2626 stop:2973 length:348 start_codon:yes stop_codon:yes gene_type:complete
MTEIKEAKIKLKIKEGETLTSKISELINGHLESITYNVIKGPVNFGIYLKDYNQVILCELLDVFGGRQLVLRTDTHTEFGNKFNFTQDKWALNDKLFILIEGLPNSEIEFTVRWS